MLLEVLVGQRWPEADEDALRECAAVWTGLGRSVADEHARAGQAAGAIVEANNGSQIDAFHTAWTRLSSKSVPEVGQLCAGQAESLERFAGDTEACKEFIIIQLEILAAEVGLALFSGAFTFGVTDAAAALAAAATRVTVGAALRELAEEAVATAARLALRGGAEALLNDGLLQSLRAVHGGSGFDLSEMVTAGTGGMIAGAVTGPATHALHDTLAEHLDLPAGHLHPTPTIKPGSGLLPTTLSAATTQAGRHVASTAVDVASGVGGTLAGNTAAAAAQAALTGQPLSGDAIVGGLGGPVLHGVAHSAHTHVSGTGSRGTGPSRGDHDGRTQADPRPPGPAPAPSRPTTGQSARGHNPHPGPSERDGSRRPTHGAEHTSKIPAARPAGEPDADTPRHATSPPEGHITASARGHSPAAPGQHTARLRDAAVLRDAEAAPAPGPGAAHRLAPGYVPGQIRTALEPVTAPAGSGTDTPAASAHHPTAPAPAPARSHQTSEHPSGHSDTTSTSPPPSGSGSRAATTNAGSTPTSGDTVAPPPAPRPSASPPSAAAAMANHHGPVEAGPRQSHRAVGAALSPNSAATTPASMTSYPSAPSSSGGLEELALTRGRLGGDDSAAPHSQTGPDPSTGAVEAASAARALRSNPPPSLARPRRLSSASGLTAVETDTDAPPRGADPMHRSAIDQRRSGRGGARAGSDNPVGSHRPASSARAASSAPDAPPRPSIPARRASPDARTPTRPTPPGGGEVDPPGRRPSDARVPPPRPAHPAPPETPSPAPRQSPAEAPPAHIGGERSSSRLPSRSGPALPEVGEPEPTPPPSRPAPSRSDAHDPHPPAGQPPAEAGQQTPPRPPRLVHPPENEEPAHPSGEQPRRGATTPGPAAPLNGTGGTPSRTAGTPAGRRSTPQLVDPPRPDGQQSDRQQSDGQRSDTPDEPTRAGAHDGAEPKEAERKAAPEPPPRPEGFDDLADLDDFDEADHSDTHHNDEERGDEEHSDGPSHDRRGDPGTADAGGSGERLDRAERDGPSPSPPRAATDHFRGSDSTEDGHDLQARGASREAPGGAPPGPARSPGSPAAGAAGSWPGTRSRGTPSAAGRQERRAAPADGAGEHPPTRIERAMAGLPDAAQVTEGGSAGIPSDTARAGLPGSTRDPWPGTASAPGDRHDVAEAQDAMSADGPRRSGSIDQRGPGPGAPPGPPPEQPDEPVAGDEGPDDHPERGRTDWRTARGLTQLLDSLGDVTEVTEPVMPGLHACELRVVRFADGGAAAYKPASGELYSEILQLPQGAPALREAIAWHIDTLLGLGVVPPTILWDGPHGLGALQRWITPSEAGFDHDEYTTLDVHRMAVLDYILANPDRHPGNYLSDELGHIVAIDHGYALQPHPHLKILSDFVLVTMDEPLTPSLMKSIRAVTPQQFHDELEALGLDQPSIDGAVSRFTEIRDNGMITGQSWPLRVISPSWEWES